MRATVLMLCLIGCSFDGGKGGENQTIDAGVDAMNIDAAPPSPAVRVVDIAVSSDSIRAGDYGIDVAVTIDNELKATLELVEVTLTFSDANGDRSIDFDWRDADAREAVGPQPTTIEPSQSLTYHFVVDATFGLDGNAIGINAEAAFVVDNMPMSATPLVDSVEVAVVDPAVIVVNQVLDEVDGGNPQISLREAIVLANADENLSRITFDPVVFDQADPQSIVILNENGELPALDSDIILDGTGAGVRLEPPTNGAAGLERYGLVINSGEVLIGGIEFRNLSRYYPVENLSMDNCGTLTTHAGGAIRVDGGTVVLDGNRFNDRNVGERNCFASVVHFVGGVNHRIVNNEFTNPVGDFVRIDAPTIEVRENIFGPGAQPARADDGIFVGNSGNQDLWIVGNVIFNLEFSGLLVDGTGTEINVAHNTFVDCGGGRSSVWRENEREMNFRNNVYVRSDVSGINDFQNDGSLMDIEFESSFPDPLCTNCGSATRTGASDLNVDPMLVDDNGSVRDDFAPATGSPLIDFGSEGLDRNGRRPGLFDGVAVDRGAIETMP